MAAAHYNHPALTQLTHQPLGPAFRPNDASLINHYLLPKIMGQQQQLLHCGFIVINEADVYSKPPYQLAAEHAPAPGSGQWYFFTNLRYTGDKKKRVSRLIGGGTAGMMERWCSDRKSMSVDETLCGYVKKFYHEQKEAKDKEWVRRTGWAMEEFSYDGYDTVLCKVYNRPPSATAEQAELLQLPAAAAAAAYPQPPLREAVNYNDLLDDNWTALLHT